MIKKAFQKQEDTGWGILLLQVNQVEANATILRKSIKKMIRMISAEKFLVVQSSKMALKSKHI